MAHKLLNLLAVTSLAIIACSFGAEPVKAVSNNHVRDGLRGHDALAKRKRSNNAKRCKVRSTPTVSANATSATDVAYAISSTVAPTTTWSDTSSSSTWTSSSSSSAAASASASASNTPSSTSSGNFGSGKACVAWPNGDQPYLGDYKTSASSLIYTWDETTPSNAASLGFTFAPQLWGWKNADAFKQTVVAGYSNVALFLNEPNEPQQSVIDPQTAATMWKTYMEPLKSQGYTLVSAATSSNPNGKTWMQEFFTACNGGCTVDIMAVHWYDISFPAFQAYIEDWHTSFYNLPIWVTEFAYQDFNGNDQGDLQTIQNFMSSATSWLESQDYVQKYCWFGAMLDLQNVNPLNSLMNPDGSPSSLGYQFLNS